MSSGWPEALRGFDGVALALMLGLLVGVQRGWVLRNEAAGTRFAGIRTFGLLGLAGGIAGVLFARAEVVATIVLAGAAGLILISYYRLSKSDEAISGTTSLVGLITMACGFLSAVGDELVAVTIIVFMVLLLAMRPQLHRMVRGMNEIEVTAIARFALIAMVILPLLPDRPYGPYDAWNPYKLWLVVVLVSGFSLAGYIAAKLLGPTRGTLATATAGSVVSSTAVTAALATRMKEDAGHPAILHAAVCMASMVMFIRVMLVVGLIAPFALPTLAILLTPGLLVSLAASVWLYLWSRRQPTAMTKHLEVKNPFAIGPALLLMGLVMVMSLAARWVLARYGDAELAVVLAISGAVDVDSAVITMGSLPKGTLEPVTAGIVLLPPALLNTLFKAGAAISIAGWRRSWPSVSVLGLTALALLGSLLFVLLRTGIA